MKTSRELSEDIELWEDMCIRYRPIEQGIRRAVHENLETFYNKYDIPADIHLERFRCMMYAIISLSFKLDTGDNVNKHFDFDPQEMRIIINLVDKYNQE